VERRRKAGFLCKNQEPGGLSPIDCSDTSSGYGLVIEYGGDAAKVAGFVSTGATRRALQMVGNDAEVELEIREFAGNGRPVPLGITDRLEFVDAPGHVEDLKRYRARGYTMKGNRITIFTDNDADIIEIHTPSRGSVDLGGLTVERCPPVPAMGKMCPLGSSVRHLPGVGVPPDPGGPDGVGVGHVLTGWPGTAPTVSGAEWLNLDRVDMRTGWQSWRVQRD
jgi:hypothetical protein